MSHHKPIERLATHTVDNQPPPLEDYDLLSTDPVLEEAILRESAGWAMDSLRQFGERLGRAEVLEWGRQANRFPPELETFDRFGRRLDEVRYHPAYHQLMELALANRVHSVAWQEARPGAHVAHAALLFLLSQVEAGVCCPVAMTYAAVPALRRDPELFELWGPRLLSDRYDPRFLPAERKQGATFGMAMTEKQGGSDVRSNTTRARSAGEPGAYLLEGHKWFCSAPMSDAFLSLAQTGGGLTCFLVPRWKPDGSRNPFFIQRLKDKLGNRSNASSEIEYSDTWALRLGEEGDGVRSIVPMVNHTRLDAAVAAASLMRQAFVQAAHHAAHRSAFGKRLIEQPLMRNVLADLALESEAATTLALRVARSFDEADRDPEAEVLSRLLTALAKFWLNKRAPGQVAEALECLGGAGYVEESLLPRLYREAPLNGIWEGSGNVICLDVLRLLRGRPEVLERYFHELEGVRGKDAGFDAALERLRQELSPLPEEAAWRGVVEQMALLVQASMLLETAPPFVSESFCRSRLRPARLGYGTLDSTLPLEKIVGRNWSAQELRV